MHPSVHRAICAITDPFCPAARGRRWPDDNGASSLTYQSRGNVTVSTAATGGKAFYVSCPVYPYGIVYAGATAATLNIGASLSLFPGSTFPAANMEQARVVSVGYVVRCVMPVTSAAGTIFAWTTPEIPYSTNLANMPDYSSGNMITKALQPGMEISIVLAPCGPGARLFQEAGISTTVTGTHDWPCLVVWYDGGPTGITPIFSVEHVVNVEFLPSFASGTGALARPPDAPAPHISRASATASNKLGQLFDGGTAFVEKKVMDAVRSIAGSNWEDALADGFGLLGFL